MFARYAIYYAPKPGHPLAKFGTSWLGWDIHTACTVAHPVIPGFEFNIEALSAVPRKYGFHGTLKAPFYLAEGKTEEELINVVQSFATRQKSFEIGRLRVNNLGGFIALTQITPNDQLAQFAGKCVVELDEFRAPMTATDIKRRLQAKLSTRQEHLMRTWGYPYIMDEFRFHLTLTGRLNGDAISSVQIALTKHLAFILKAPVWLFDMCLCGQNKNGNFQIIERFPLAP